ncbi:uncharacterized protein LOC142339727 [Convolutriloba macropyga]|uniref:uncharacterized protein LOC142339727 n=1 Tax=Convolutriloba macropyga TaxID=536237 RepID=UPI003F522D97
MNNSRFQMTKYQHISTWATSPNIAIIKYWGKSDEKDILPLNTSLSITLNCDDLRTRSSLYEVLTSDPSEKIDTPSLELYLNGQKAEIGKRLKRIEEMLRNDCANLERKSKSLVIVSENDFPTASGMASSASGFAAIAQLLCSYFEVKSDWSIYARLGSGSACRSMLGGFVVWEKGTGSDDSRAVQVFSENHWPELRVLILIFSSDRKTNPSTTGMQRSVETSELLKERLEIVPKRLSELKLAIEEKDFEQFGVICMKESNQLHAICLDTYPPIRYLNTQSFELIDTIHAFNDHYGNVLASYSFDAGANAFVFFEEQSKPKLYSWLLHVFPQCNLQLDDWSEQDWKARELNIPVTSLDEDASVEHIESRVGAGPQEMFTQIPFK